MQKYSKSSIPISMQKEIEARERDTLTRLKNKRCRHLAPGTDVVYAGRRAHVLEHYAGGFMLVQYEDGSRQTLHPYGLR